MIPVLMLALEFPPVQTTGAFRSLNLATHLNQFGIEPTIISVESDAGSEIFKASANPALLESLPAALKIERLQPEWIARKRGRVASHIARLSRVTDTFDARFRKPLHELANSKLKGQDFKAVYVSAPPFGATRLGERLADALNLPLLLDMRDAWADWAVTPYTTWFHYKATRIQEARAFARADRVVTVTQQLADVFRNQHSNLPADRFHVVPNGFIGPDFTPLTLSPETDGDKFRIGYVGNYYYTPPSPKSGFAPHRWLHHHAATEDWSYRSPLYLFKAMRKLFETHPDMATRVQFHHIGDAPPWLAEMAAKHGLGDNLILHGRKPKAEVAGLLDGMDMLLATSMKREDGGDYCLASKTFDYMLARKPVLAFVTPGAQRDFLARSGVALIVDPDDSTSAAVTLHDHITSPQPMTLQHEFLNLHSARCLAQNIARHLKEIAL